MRHLKRPDNFIQVKNYSSVLIYYYTGLLCTGSRATLNNTVRHREFKKAIEPGKLNNKRTEMFFKKRRRSLRKRES